MPASERRETEFLRVDLDLTLDRGLDQLLDALGDAVIVVAGRRDWARLALNSLGPLSLEQTLSALADAVETLPPPARRLWDQCRERRLDIGVQAELAPRSETFPLPLALVARLVACKADLALTIYAPDPDA